MRTQTEVILEARLANRMQGNRATLDSEHAGYLAGITDALNWVCKMNNAERPTRRLDRRDGSDNRCEERREDTSLEDELNES